MEIFDSTAVADCSDVLMQVDSAIGSLNSARKQIVENYLNFCIDQNLHLEPTQKAKFIKDMLALYKLNK